MFPHANKYQAHVITSPSSAQHRAVNDEYRPKPTYIPFLRFVYDHQSHIIHTAGLHIFVVGEYGCDTEQSDKPADRGSIEAVLHRGIRGMVKGDDESVSGHKQRVEQSCIQGKGGDGGEEVSLNY